MGRPAQRGRTRAALLDAAATLIAKGLTPTTTEVADAARVSRRTAYRYFPTQEQLLVESSLERLRPQVEAAIESVEIVRVDLGEGAAEQDIALAVARLDATVRIMHRLTFENEHLLRTIQRLTAGGATTLGVRPRGSRRLDWLTAAVEPIRARVGPERFARLISSLATCVGFDSFFVLRDVRGLSKAESERTTRWMAEAMLTKTIADARAVGREEDDRSAAGVA
jgi:AcrR family transcriptional regulator